MMTLLMALMQPTFLGWLLKATALLILALATTSLLRRASAGTRHVVWLSTLAGILALPVVSAWAPIRLAIVPPRLMPALPQIAAAAPIAAAASAPGVPIVEVNGLPTAAPIVTAQVSAPAHASRLPLWVTLLAIWSAIVVGLLGWLGFGALSVRRIVRTGRTLDERAWTDPLCEIADRLDLAQVPRLISSPLVEMPFACGVIDPTIVLPASAEQWSDSRRRAVLFHELAHVKRHDLVGHTLGRVACALYWFHPLVWTAARRLRAESERACDDLVLSCGARASDYADHLLDIVISVRHQGAPATAMPMARRRELEGRVLAILDPAIRRIGPGRVQSATMFAGIGVLALSVAAMAPQAERVARRGDSEALTVARIGHSGDHGTQTLVLRSLSSAPSAKPTPSPVTRQVTPAPSPLPAPSPDLSSDDATLTNALGTIGRVAVQQAAAALSGVAQRTKGKQGIDSARVSLLLKVLRSDPDASVRKMAAWGLSEAAEMPEVSDVLAGTLRSDEDDDVREMAAWSLVNSRREPARRALGTALRRDVSDNVRETAAWALANLGLHEDERQALETALSSDASDNVRETAAWALGNSPQRPASPALVAALTDKSANVRESAAWALAQIGDDDPGPQVIAAFRRETNAEVRMAELRALTFMHVDDQSVLDAALSSKDADLRARAVRMIAGAGGSWPEPRPRPRPRPMP
jgi:beta-lactamase regulating signal transducer with metallopeptidase domain